MKKLLFVLALTATVSLGAASAQSIDTSKPMATDYFSYTLTEDGKAVEITGFSNKMKEEFYDKKGKIWKRRLSSMML